MRTVGIRELKNRLSEYLRLVRRGERVLVTDRGVVVAELTKPGEAEGGSPYPGLLGPARDGRVRLGGKNRPDLYASLDPLLEPGDALKLLDAERGDS